MRDGERQRSEPTETPSTEDRPDHLLPHGAHPTAGDRVFEAGLDRLAGGLERAGRRVAGRAAHWEREGGPRALIGAAAERVGGALETGADYVRGQDPAALRADLEARVRRRPLAAVAGAVAAGFVLGRIFRS